MGPILLLIFIQILGEYLPSEGASILKYVDDTKALKKVSKEDDMSDLQDDLEKLYAWQEANNMASNSSKFLMPRMSHKTTLK